MNTQVESGTSLSADQKGYLAFCERYLPELLRLDQIISAYSPQLREAQLSVLSEQGCVLPIHMLSLGSRRRDVPVLLFVGGVHGVERIGTQILTAFLETLCRRLQWDQGLQRDLESIRLIFVPLLNPVGMARGWRANGNGVDLMRNAPLDAREKTAWMVGGHRISRHLPWYRGEGDQLMQPEAQALCQLVEQQLYQAPFSLVLDVHSGFGLRDRLWFPFAGSRDPLEHLGEVAALKELFDNAYPHHNYLIEPQCDHYLTHGDLWDYLYLNALDARSSVFLPLTLEIGSWLWVKKNPRQLASFSGLFNPIVPHRRQRALRRHHLLLEFLLRATCSAASWLPKGQMRSRYLLRGIKNWYG